MDLGIELVHMSVKSVYACQRGQYHRVMTSDVEQYYLNTMIYSSKQRVYK
jgi:hypothetical protein